MRGLGASAFESEIREQPDVLSRLLTQSRSPVEEAAGAIRSRSPRFVVLAAHSSSDSAAAQYALYVLGAHNRLAVAFAAPILHTLYGAPPRLDDALVVGISQSGDAPDVRAVLEDARRRGAVTLAMSNQEDSPLAKVAELHLSVGAGPVQAIASSKTYTGQLTLLAMLSTALADDEGHWRELRALPTMMANAVAGAEPARHGAILLTEASRIAVLGRGFNDSTAHEIATKLTEVCHLAAEPYSWADFLLGPIAVVEPGFPIIVVAPSGRASHDAQDVLAELRQRGATLVVVSDRSDLLHGVTVELPLPAGVPEWLSPITSVVTGQLLSLALAQARGLDPDRPRNPRKIALSR